MKVAIVSGTSINRSEVFSSWQLQRVETPFGGVVLRQMGDFVALNRHGEGHYGLPHQIEHRANVTALRRLGVEQVVTFSSVGSCDPALGPGSIVSIGDYASFAPLTFQSDELEPFAPVLENPLLERIAACCPQQAIERGKVYFQTRGPRFETKAEVRALRLLGADVVGMTFANEADLILESGLGLTAFAMVDNYAHGVTAHSLSKEAFEVLVRENQSKVDAFLGGVIGALSAGA